jgi:serine/threonine protein kinase
MDRDRAFATILLELGVSSRAHIDQALAAKAQGDERSLGKILLANGWLDEPGYLRALDAQRAREALDVPPPPPEAAPAAGARLFAADGPTPERMDLEKKRRAARAAVQKGAMVAEAAANAPFLRKLIGRQIGKVQCDRLIAKGQMAFTLSGSLDGRAVRVKVLRPDLAENPRALARFDREFAALARVDHPCVARVLDHGQYTEDSGQPVRWFATESDDGETLAQRLQRERILDPNEVVAFGQDVAHGLAAAHKEHVVHRDVRPETIFVTKSGAVRIFDFGVARDEDDTANLTLKGQILGAAEFAAPELASGKPAGPGADVYALGVTLFLALTGELPYGCKSVVRLLTLHASAPIPWANKINPHVPRPLAALIRDLLAKKPEDRPTMNDAAFRLSDPRILDENAPEPEECVGCGADVNDPLEESSVPVCAECVADVEAGHRCGGCLEVVKDGVAYAGRTYCKKCHGRLLAEQRRS